MAKSKRRNNGNLFLFIISCIIFIFGLFFIADPIANFMRECSIFAGGMLVVGMAYLAFYSLTPSAAVGEWPIVEGLLDVLLAIVLFMSMSTTKTDMILYIIAVWALAGAVSRFICALKLPQKAQKQAFFNAGACLLAAVFMAGMTAFVSWYPQPVAGIGMVIYSFGSFVSPRKAFGSSAKKAA